MATQNSLKVVEKTTGAISETTQVGHGNPLFIRLDCFVGSRLLAMTLWVYLFFTNKKLGGYY
jgi:hypothetical protein